MRFRFVFLLFCLLSNFCRANDPFDRNDAWEFFNILNIGGTEVWPRDSITPNFDRRDTFGGTFSTQEAGTGNFAFSDDGRPADHIDYIEFETFNKTPLIAYRVVAATEFGALLRQTMKVVLLAKKDAGSAYEKVDEFVPAYLPGTAGETRAGVSDTSRPLAKMTVSKFWRIEFHREPNTHLGPRIIEVDASVAENVNPTQLDVLSPQPNAVFTAPVDITFDIKAQDLDGIDEIYVKSNGALIGSRKDNGTILFEDAPPGLHFISVGAVDGLGGVTTQEFQIEVLEKEPEIRIKNPRVDKTDLVFDVEGYSAGAFLDVYSSSDLKNWTLETTQPTTDVTWTFSMPFVGLKFFKVTQKE